MTVSCVDGISAGVWADSESACEDWVSVRMTAAATCFFALPSPVVELALKKLANRRCLPEYSSQNLVASLGGSFSHGEPHNMASRSLTVLVPLGDETSMSS